MKGYERDLLVLLNNKLRNVMQINKILNKSWSKSSLSSIFMFGWLSWAISGGILRGNDMNGGEFLLNFLRHILVSIGRAFLWCIDIQSGIGEYLDDLWSSEWLWNTCEWSLLIDYLGYNSGLCILLCRFKYILRDLLSAYQLFAFQSWESI